MKRFFFGVLAFLLLAPLPGSLQGAVLSPVRVAAPRTPPLVQLGGLLQGAVASQGQVRTLSWDPQPAGAVPAALDVQKAGALMSRLPESAPWSQAPAPQAAAREVLGALNATLKDFSPEDLRKMPIEDLHALSSVVLDQMGRSHAAADDRGLELIAEKRLGLIMAQRGKPGRGTLSDYAAPESVHLLRSGGKSRKKPDAWMQEPKEGMVFRHYTTKDGAQGILKASRLWNGILPYVKFAPPVLCESFEAVTGIFLTLPDVKGGKVGVPSDGGFTDYVDVLVPKGFPILEIERGSIYLIPLPERTRDGDKNRHRRWIQGATVSPTGKTKIREMDAAGGPGPELSVPIKIIGHGKAE